MKICFVLEYYYPHVGGAETFFKNLAETLAKKGHECSVVTIRVPGTVKRETIGGVEVFRVDVPKFLGRYWFTVLSLPLVCRIAKRCDILHTRTYNGAFPAFLAARLVKKPAVITVFEALLSLWKTLSGMRWLDARLHELFERAAITVPFDRYICTSYYTRNQVRLLGIDDKKLTVIYPGIDHDLFRHQEEGGRMIRERLGLKENFVYLYFGRPGFFKGVEFLLKAVPLISKKIPESRLMLILSKEPGSKYRQALSLIDDLKIAHSVTLLDSVRIEELVKHISGCDCVVTPSLTEGFGFTCAEACAVGKPVVVADTGSIPEVVSGRYVLVIPGSPEDICRGVESVYNGQTDYLPKRSFDWRQCAEKHEKIYRETLDKKTK